MGQRQSPQHRYKKSLRISKTMPIMTVSERLCAMSNPKSAPTEDPVRFGASELRRLGRYLLEQRKAAGLTLRLLSDRAEISVASIRAMEAGRTSPSLTTVLRVVSALGLTIDRVVAEALTKGARVVVTRASSAHGPSGHPLSEGLEDATLEARQMEIAPRALQKVPTSLSDAPSFCMVIDGTLVVAKGKAERVRLEAGDSYLARAGEVQTWANTGAESAHLICVADRTLRDDGTRQP